MRIFTCAACSQTVYFENVRCMNCGHALAFLPDLAIVSAIEILPDSPGMYAALAPVAAGRKYRLCANSAEFGVCNSAIVAEDPESLCPACRLNQVIPDLSTPEALPAWHRLECAKRRLFYTLRSLRLPIESRRERKNGLAFSFMQDMDGGSKVFTGHSDGLITINIAEADDPFREKLRKELSEVYRTVLGHFRHEIGHYYWDRLIWDSEWLPACRALFGDERVPYDEAMGRHYAEGPPEGWSANYVSAYATMHPWEDWAETWAHYLHMVDTLETARAYGLVLQPKPLGGKPTPTLSTRALHFDDFEDLIRGWVPLTVALNSFNRSMGIMDAYPFVLGPAVTEKLNFVHDVIEHFDSEPSLKQNVLTRWPAFQIRRPAFPEEPRKAPPTGRKKTRSVSETAARARERRLPALHRIRDLKMARDAHAYVRGSTERFYAWLASGAGRLIPAGPTVWICGDAHVGNLGPIARSDETIRVELRDLDQTVLGNPAYDLVRLALSLAMAARSADLPGVVTARLVEELMSGYLDAFSNPDEPTAADDSAAVRFVVREALRRKWRHLHRERLGRRPRFPIGKRFLPLVAEEREAVSRFLNKERVRRLVTRLDCRDDDASIRVLDAAYWVKGCSSLGLWRCAVLVDVVGHGQKKGGYALLDIKEAVAAVAPAGAPPEDRERIPQHHGERVVSGALALSPTLGERMLAGTVLGHEVFVRELMPQDLKLELEMFDDVEARATARALARIVGAAHARQLTDATRESWRTELARASTRWLEAPSWLWQSVVELVGIHERAYLEHCRRYALNLERERERAAEA